jgi:hypothetical protein
MDWFTVLMIVLFFVLPMIQQVLEAKKKAESGAGDPMEGYPEEYQRVGVAFPDAVEETRRLPSAERASWSDGWGSWPGTESVESVDRPATEVEVVVHRRTPVERVPAETSREAREIVVRDRSPETIQPRTTAPARVLADVTRSLPAHAPARGVAPSTPVARVAPRSVRANRSHPLLSQLRSGRPDALRDAIVASEIVSRPRALRPLE